MSIHTKSDFKISSWDQRPYDEPKEGPKLLQTDVKRSFQGDIEAESIAVLLMCQADDGSAGYVATEKVVGRIGSRSGSFVIQHGGAVASGNVTDSFGYVVPGSGTDELQGLRGHCVWHHDEHEATFTLDYDIE
ncbi:DUF3224 domain-containing protein [Ktedonobacter racemifer]|uniref:DUF3224 domain-containing protein n=1 Tax=Ktedonobacter racemifer DSM 44963 TaxID=485913 RepID=D6TD12_KTERA|nr:DUF3224 domain-containing protein [Ktedonobacter racemifer]EFH90063.1 conserved hypothetical protein [Ktedonobacter racemifer DSM 44963]